MSHENFEQEFNSNRKVLAHSEATNVEKAKDHHYEKSVDAAEARLIEINGILDDLRINPAEYSPEYIESLAQEQEELEKQARETNQLRNTKLNAKNN